MFAFIIRRLLYAPLLVFGVALVTFIIFNVVGGNPVYTLAGKNATPKQIHDLTHEYGFDRPLFADVDFLARRLRQGALSEAAATLRDIAPRKRALAQLSDGASQLAESTALAELERDALQLLRANVRLAVPELVALALETDDVPTAALASFELDTLVFNDLAFAPSASPATVAERRARIAGWWQENAATYSYSFDAGATLRSLGSSQFARYIREVFTFDFGQSYKKRGKPVIEIIASGAPVSLMLTVPSFLVATVISVLIGLFSAYHQGRFADRVVVIASVSGLSISILVWIILGQVFLAHRLGWFPVQGYDGLTGFKYFLLPWLIWTLSDLGADVRFFRTAMVDELTRDYIRTARAKGLSSTTVMLRHLLKNAMIPILTYVIIAIPSLYTGSLLIEKFFSLPGLGKETVEAILSSDFPVIRAMTLIGSVLFILADILTNIAYAVVDPRVRLK